MNELNIRWARMDMNLARRWMRRWHNNHLEARTDWAKQYNLREAQREKRRMIKKVDELTKLLYPNGLPHLNKPEQLELF